MAMKYNLMPNESVLLQETGVAHGGLIAAAFTDELLLTNLNIVCINKGMFGNTKNVFQYPLNQITIYNDKPQVKMGKLSNGTPTLDVYFKNGGCEKFSFSLNGRRIINNWINEIYKLFGVEESENDFNKGYDPNSFVGAIMGVGDQVKDVGSEVLGALGFNPAKKKTQANIGTNGPEKISKKCVSCSAPLVGYKGKIVKCKYCDTEQTL